MLLARFDNFYSNYHFH